MYVSSAIKNLLGYQPEEIVGRHLFEILVQESIDTVSQGYQDFIARLAGDEFVAILPGIGDNSAIDLLATRLIESFHQTILIGAHKVRIGVSIGISFFPEDADSVNTLISYADQAMYEAKKNGGSKYVCESDRVKETIAPLLAA